MDQVIKGFMQQCIRDIEVEMDRDEPSLVRIKQKAHDIVAWAGICEKDHTVVGEEKVLAPERRHRWLWFWGRRQ